MFESLWMPNYGFRMTGNIFGGRTPAAILARWDAYTYSASLIARYELTLWFEPEWRVAKALARRFPHCTVLSIPEESYTPSLFRVPGWRPKRPQPIL
ncbi:hypothetical protein [Chthonomonas calidirosea]|uniref:Uncharacterized protein n=1 Tax=Chthonomonas calidirosea (strain DSM 23976 / ICMP 18418 / T49) TaxID=1303518 RepID=S0ETF5_CHTCT|nr:hypothetical protein [Chthonomonas calidirosea]CCW34784.1 hypothetical protein CCALI_00962 [Chthonomonas calidirosea T49]CEK12773.1 hypothetical protein CP488_00194 [Chthonomonas calidirosea]CEK13806.1 hypothetical protein CTKA_00198 [Chthonomonas calidirosea]